MAGAHGPTKRDGTGGAWLALCLLAARVEATPADGAASVEGHVVALEGADVVVDLASDAGAREGDVVELWRPYRLEHPVTGRLVLDRFRIGALRLGQVQQRLSLA